MTYPGLSIKKNREVILSTWIQSFNYHYLKKEIKFFLFCSNRHMTTIVIEMNGYAIHSNMMILIRNNTSLHGLPTAPVCLVYRFFPIIFEAISLTSSDLKYIKSFCMHTFLFQLFMYHNPG